MVKTRLLFCLTSIASVLMSATTKAEDPTALATTTNVTVAGGTSYSFSVLYSDDGFINVASLDDNDIRVTGPLGFDVGATFVGLWSRPEGSAVTAIYSITPPGGSWDSVDDGAYQVRMQPMQVFDIIGNPVAAGIIGYFSVMVPGTAAGTFGNISTRLPVETEDNILIGGFIVTGTQPKKIIVRALGPSLPVSGALGNPTLELRNSSGLVASNDNWRDTQEGEIIATTIPPTNDLESAIVATVPANSSAYTAIVRGVNNGTGIGVVEVYDLDPTVDSRLANISTRGFVQMGDDVLIGGLIVLGQNPLRVIVRALGPSLPVQGALADPSLELRDGNGGQIAVNDNWRSTQEAEIIATTLAPSSDQEAAIVRSLSPGSYTAVVRGVNSTTGIAVVEAYNLD